MSRGGGEEPAKVGWTRRKNGSGTVDEESGRRVEEEEDQD